MPRHVRRMLPFALTVHLRLDQWPHFREKAWLESSVSATSRQQKWGHAVGRFFGILKWVAHHAITETELAIQAGAVVDHVMRLSVPGSNSSRPASILARASGAP